MGNYKLWAAFALATIVFYFVPLFDSQTSIQGDAVDIHYSAQKYFADSLRQGHLPHWTPYLFSGFPFLADPKTGAWYPLHWPFFVLGITPRAIEWELALHAFLALWGTYLLARRLTGDHALALLAAVFYAGGGSFTAQSAHVGMFETAALLPWLLWSATRAVEGSSLVLPGAIGGLIALIGDYQAALCCLGALVLLMIGQRAPWKRTAGVLAGVVVVGMLLGAIQILPALELAAQSIHAAANIGLKPAALATLVYPNLYGAISGIYSGPGDATQFYFYAGILLVPLAIVGALKKRSTLVLLAPALLCAFVAIHVWFVVALGLALAAGSGAAWLAERFQKPWVVYAALMLTVADVWYWNMADNPLAYLSQSFAEKYGDPYTSFESHLAPVKQRPLARIWSPFDSSAFGPLNGSLEGRTEVTYGYNALELARYREYMHASEQNAGLLNGLAVTHGIDTQRGAIVENTRALPRIYAPPQVKFVASHAAAVALLPSLDPAQWAIVETPLRPLAPGATMVEMVDYTGDSYRAKYSAPFDCLLRIAVPYYPGWTAAIDGKSTAVYAVDGALSGVFAPAGDHELTFRYRSNWFVCGALASALTLIGIILSSTFLARRR
jgi:hypothetical protein